MSTVKLTRTPKGIGSVMTSDGRRFRKGIVTEDVTEEQLQELKDAKGVSFDEGDKTKQGNAGDGKETKS